MARITKPAEQVDAPAGDSAAAQQLREEASAIRAESATPDLVLAAQKRAAAAAVKDPAFSSEVSCMFLMGSFSAGA